MGVMMDVNYRIWDTETNSDVVGWPLPKTAKQAWAYQRIAGMAAEFKAAGFTVVRMPPSCHGAAGEYSGGYDLYDPYNLEGTAFGNGEMLRQCVAVIHSNGLQAYGDLVLHQYDGGSNGVYPTKRFPKTPSCFVGDPPRVPVDPVPDQQGNFAFGDMCAYMDSLPRGYMHDGTIAAAQWLTATIDFDGYRIDDVKGTYAPLVYDLLHADGIKDLYAFGEYFDGSDDPLYNWVHGYMRGRAAVLDFGFKFNVGRICNNNSNSWMGKLSSIGYCTLDAANAVTFVESADTDGSPGEQTIWNKLLGYALMLTLPGYPCVYYRDWSDDPGCYGLKEPINNLVWIHEHLANGSYITRYSSFQVFVHERLGYNGLPGCICAFNNDQWDEYTVTVNTSHPPNTRLHEYTGHYNTDIWTDWQGRATFTVGRNNNGHGYLVFGLWIDPPGFEHPILATTQVFYGADDLSIPALRNGTIPVGRVYAAAGTRITAVLRADSTTAAVVITQPSGVLIDPLHPLPATGFYALSVTAVLPATTTVPFALHVTYTAPKTT